jgi:hypothetical protein
MHAKIDDILETEFFYVIYTEAISYNQYNQHVSSIGQGEARHRKYIRPKLGRCQAYCLWSEIWPRIPWDCVPRITVLTIASSAVAVSQRVPRETEIRDCLNLLWLQGGYGRTQQGTGTVVSSRILAQKESAGNNTGVRTENILLQIHNTPWKFAATLRSFEQ